MYEQWTPSPSRRQRELAVKKAKQRFHQFIFTLSLFLCVFSSNNSNFIGVFQDYLPENLRFTFSHLGSSLPLEHSFFQELEHFIEVMTMGEQEAVFVISSPVSLDNSSEVDEKVEDTTDTIHESSTTELDSFYYDSLALFASPSFTVNSRLWSDLMKEIEEKETLSTDLSITDTSSEVESVPMSIGTILQSGDSSLPDTHTNDFLFLGDRQTTSPVSSIITSPYGVRANPFTGESSIHSGLDLRGSVGTPILAWSSGVVESVGHTNLVGYYVRLNHGDEIRSFYAHCSELLVEEGQQVEVGEEIAKVGATGEVTGSHLHFEIKWGDLYLNPIYYVDNQEELD